MELHFTDVRTRIIVCRSLHPALFGRDVGSVWGDIQKGVSGVQN
jgi:hypothetical protein